MPNDTVNLAATNDSLFSSLTFATNHLPNGEEGVSLIYDHYPDLNSDDLDTRTIAATEAATDWWFGSGSHFEADAHAR